MINDIALQLVEVDVTENAVIYTPLMLWRSGPTSQRDASTAHNAPETNDLLISYKDTQGRRQQAAIHGRASAIACSNIRATQSGASLGNRFDVAFTALRLMQPSLNIGQDVAHSALRAARTSE